jgi:hypothetical protein
MAGSGDLSEMGKKEMRLTSSQITGFGGSRRWRVVRRRDWRGQASGGAVVSARELGDSYGGNGVSGFRLGCTRERRKGLGGLGEAAGTSSTCRAAGRDARSRAARGGTRGGDGLWPVGH